MQNASRVQEMNEPSGLGEEADDCVKRWVRPAARRLFNQVGIETDHIEQVINQQAVPLVADVDDEIDTRLFSYRRLKSEPQPHVDDWDDPSTQVEEPRDCCRSQWHPIDLSCPQHLGNHRSIDGETATSDDEAAPPGVGCCSGRAGWLLGWTGHRAHSRELFAATLGGGGMGSPAGRNRYVDDLSSDTADEKRAEQPRFS